ncbi:MAG: alkaline phosphatase family protein [Armatimonadota bacterium]|nr:alkaline phosphatase family protein [Armatimonadota bacterium]MDR7467248.1 alkaline phosphatase family protein [Armatimonadota bacterium]MDR7494509.1 alkaline phosphatase family protein [Armatimonadota bacterium]MDR7499914.1 alkaline phosphatase family protein [Armatimonadota bacterium]MDR7504524.1 alkaline phosphatase family protein [Armatimonadota bacterium]
MKLTRYSWDAVAAYRSPFVTPLPRGAGGPALTRRVVLVVVDGLRLDASRAMTTLNSLREQGADFTAWTEEPSLSYPGWTVIASGATPEVSGVTTNWYEGRVPVDHLFASALSARLRTGVAGSPGWAMLFDGAVEARVLVKDPEDYTDVAAAHRTSAEATEGALDLLAQDVEFLLLHLPGVDILGHGFGGASPQYAEGVRRTDGHLAQVLQAVDLATTTLIVTADHGHTDAGGHGGWETAVKRVPLVLAGAGIRRGVQGADVRQSDIAPTVAALLGIPIPSHSQGRPLVEALDGDLSTLPRRWAEQQRNFYSYVAGFLGHLPLAALFTDARLNALHDDGPDGIVALADEIAGDYAAGREARLERERRRRLPVAVGAAFLPLIYLALHGRKRVLLPAALGAAVFFAVDYGLFFARGGSFSLSVFNSEAMIQRFFQRRLLDAAVAVSAGALLAGLLTARGGMGDAARAGLDTGMLTGYALLLQVLYFFWRWDIAFAWYLPDLRAGFKYYLDLLKMVPVGVLAPGYMLVAVLGRGIARTLFAFR